MKRDAPPLHLKDVVRQLLLAAPIRLWALILAGPPLTFLAAWLVWIVWRGGWPIESWSKRLDILGAGLLGALLLVAVIVVSLASVKLEAETKLGKLSIGGDGHEDPPPPIPPADAA